MCCQSMRILILFSVTALSFVLNYFLPSIVVIAWYLILINIVAFVIFLFDFKRLKEEKEGIKYFNLYYFSIIGGVFGAIFALIISKFYEKTKLFISLQAFLFIIWSVIIFLGFNNYTQISNFLAN